VKFSTKRKKKKENLVEYLLEENKQFFSKILPNFFFLVGKTTKFVGGKNTWFTTVRIVRFIICS
jgi:hypothetical protein